MSDGQHLSLQYEPELFPGLIYIQDEQPKIVLKEDCISPDVVLWRRNENDYSKRFTTTETWQQIRARHPTVPWSKVIWFPLGVPWFAFITWIAIRNRLSTGDRMHAWGQVKGCLFCGEPNETRDHLFFASPYTYTLWLEAVGTLLGRSPDPDWEETLAHLATHGFERLTYLLLRLVFQTTFYIIWRERETIEGIIKDLVKSGSWLNSLGRQ